MNLKYIVPPLILAITFVLSSCNSSSPTKETVSKTPEAQCLAQGGEWKRLTRGGNLTCNERFSDAGKACNDGAACQSNTCLAPRRDSQSPAQCAATTSAVIHAGCTGGKIAGGKVVPVGCP